MKTSTIITLILLVFFLSASIYLIVNLKGEGKEVIRHFIGKKQISKPHKFSEWEKCEICVNCYKKKNTIKIIRENLNLNEHPPIIDEKVRELEAQTMWYGNNKIAPQSVIVGKRLNVGVVFDNDWRPNDNNFYGFYCKECGKEIYSCIFADKKGDIDIDKVLKSLKEHKSYWHK